MLRMRVDFLQFAKLLVPQLARGRLRRLKPKAIMAISINFSLAYVSTRQGDSIAPYWSSTEISPILLPRSMGCWLWS
jgi:hypothetical protein